MPRATPSPKSSAGKTGNPLARRVGGFPAIVWIGGLVVAIGVGLYIRHRMANTNGTSASSQAPAQVTGTGDTGGASSQADTGQADLADAFNNLAYVLGSGFAPVATSTSTGLAGATTSSSGDATTTASTQQTAPTYDAALQTATAQNQAAAVQAIEGNAYGGSSTPFIKGFVDVPISSSGQPATITQQQAILKAVSISPVQKIPAATAHAVDHPAIQQSMYVTNATKVTAGANGTKLYTQPSGAVIAIAPGKTPYRVSK